MAGMAGGASCLARPPYVFHLGTILFCLLSGCPPEIRDPILALVFISQCVSNTAHEGGFYSFRAGPLASSTLCIKMWLKLELLTHCDEKKLEVKMSRVDEMMMAVFVDGHDCGLRVALRLFENEVSSLER